MRDQLIALAVQKPQGLGEPFALWTLERLQRAFQARYGVHLPDSTIWTWLHDEGLVWKRQQSWFHEPARHDPAFAPKRRPSFRPTWRRRRALVFSEHRDSASHIRLLEHVLRAFPSEHWLLIEDNLSAHLSRDTRAALVPWPEITLRLLPKYAAWLNLIEPWWKVLCGLALKSRRFETLAELGAALRDALAYWNAHRHPYRWRKHPQHQPAPALHT